MHFAAPTMDVHTMNIPSNNATITSSTSAHSRSSSLTLTGLLDVADGVLVRHMAAFLEGNNASKLSQLSREWKNFMQSHEEYLFRDYLRQDFAPGSLLLDAVKRRKEQQQERAKNGEEKAVTSSFSYKQLYIAFRRRWKLPHDSADEALLGGNTNGPLPPSSVPGRNLPPVVVPWSNPYDYCRPPKEPSMDAQALAFIVRVGNVNDNSDPETCALMEWEEETETPGQHWLVVDEQWYHFGDDGCGHCIDFPFLKNQVCRWIDDWCDGSNDHNLAIDTAIRATYLLSLYVVDLEKYQVVTLMENSWPCLKKLNETTIDTFCHGIDVVNVYGVKPPGSPFHRPSADFERHDCQFHWADEDNKVENFKVFGGLRLDRLHDHHGNEGKDDDIVYAEGVYGISFRFAFDETTLVRRDEICSFLRALMKEKCHQAPVSGFVHETTIAQQPTWVVDASVLDTILSFASFEQQAGDLRVVCSQFKDSAMRQLETKLLDRVKVIGFEGWYSGWFKGSVRRGWSDDPFAVSKDSVIEESLRMALCRCCAFGGNAGSCPGMDRCPGTKGGVTLGRGNYKNSGFNRDEARKQLETTGMLKLKANLHEVQKDRWEWPADIQVATHFEEGEKSLFRVCEEVLQAVKKEVSYEIVPESFWGLYGLTGEATHTKLAGGVPSEQFIRSLFLVFLHKPKHDQDGESSSKAVHLAQTSIGVAKSNVDGQCDQYVRMKMIARFSTLSGEPIEILLESKHNID